MNRIPARRVPRDRFPSSGGGNPGSLFGGGAPGAHTHLEADITDLDKYTQAAADSLFLKLDASNDPMTAQLEVPSILSDFVQFDIAYVGSAAEGVLQWNSEDGTLEVGLPGGNVALQIGQESLVRCRNASGSTIPIGSLVRVVGAQGNKPLLALADASTEATAHVLGLTTEEFLNNSNGFVTISGLVRGLDTSGTTEGDIVYLSEIAGEFTTTPPTPPAVTEDIGHILAVHVNQGVIQASIHHSSTLSADQSDVLIASIASGELLKWTGSLWENNTLAEAGISASVHTHLEADISDLDKYSVAAADLAFAPIVHTHLEADITDLGAYLLLAGGTLSGTLQGQAVVVNSGKVLRVQDAGNTDFATWSHGGTNFALVLTNTSNYSISGLTGQMTLDGLGLRVVNNTGGYRSINAAGTGSVILVSLDSSDIGQFMPGGQAANFGGTLSQSGTAVSLLGHTHTESDITDIGPYLTNDTTRDAATDVDTLVGSAKTHAYGSGAANAPSSFGNILHLFNASDVNTQFAMSHSSDAYWRGAASSSLVGVAWKTLLDSTNFGNYALPLSGGVITGTLTIDGGTLNANVKANSNTLMSIGETTTLRGDSQDGAIRLFGEQSGAIKYVQLKFSGANLGISSNLSGAALQVSMLLEAVNGGVLRIRDAGNTDWGEWDHDGTDFTLTLTNTTDYNITGAHLKMGSTYDIFPAITQASDLGSNTLKWGKIHGRLIKAGDYDTANGFFGIGTTASGSQVMGTLGSNSTNSTTMSWKINDSVGSFQAALTSAIGAGEFFEWYTNAAQRAKLDVNGLTLNQGFGMAGTAAVTTQTVTGSRAGNAAVASLLTALAAFGLITDSSTA